jgi:hypothetical protein
MLASGLEVLMDLEQLPNRRLVRFLLHVLGDRAEAEEVRIYALRRLRDGGELLPTDLPPVAWAIGDVLADTSAVDLRLQAALALGEFIRVERVLARLSAVCLDQEESIDLRYAAFTSLERTRPTPGCAASTRGPFCVLEPHC